MQCLIGWFNNLFSVKTYDIESIYSLLFVGDFWDWTWLFRLIEVKGLSKVWNIQKLLLWPSRVKQLGHLLVKHHTFKSSRYYSKFGWELDEQPQNYTKPAEN